MRFQGGGQQSVTLRSLLKGVYAKPHPHWVAAFRRQLDRGEAETNKLLVALGLPRSRRHFQ